MAPQIRYDSEWEEVKVINAFVVLTVYVSFAMRGVGYLVIMWTTVVLLGGFVSVIDNADFWRLTLITLMQILWMHAPSLLQKLLSIRDLFHRLKTVNNLLKRNWVQDDNPGADDPGQPIIVAVVGFALSLIHIVVLYMCIGPLYYAVVYGMFISTWISIRGLMQHDYHGHNTDEGRTNMATAHNVLHVLCVVQGGLWLYKIILVRSEKQIVKQVSRAYFFEDGGCAISAYLAEIQRGYNNKPHSPKGNLITYALELMDSKVPSKCLSGTLILYKLLTRQHLDKIKTPNLMKKYEKEQQQQQQLEDKTGAAHLNKKEMSKEEKYQLPEEDIITMQRKVIKGLIGSTSYTHALQKLLETLDPRSTYDIQMRGAAATIVEHVADVIRLEQFPRGTKYISSLISTFKEYNRLQSYQSSLSSNTIPKPSPNTTNGHEECVSHTATTSSKSQSPESDNAMDMTSLSMANKSKTNNFHGYKELVLVGLRILQRLARSVDNCIIISNTKHLVSKIIAPIRYDLVHRTHHSMWSTKVVEGSLGVIIFLIASNEETRAKMLQQISSDDKAIATMERIVMCEECKGVDLKVAAMVILKTLLHMNGETESRVNFTKMLLRIFTNGNNNEVLIRMTAGQALEIIFFGNKTVDTTPSTVNNNASEFVDGLFNIVSQVGDNETCRKFAAETLERLCNHYAANKEILYTLKNSMTSVMPMVFREILLGYSSIGEGNPVYDGSCVDVESQVPINDDNTASQVDSNNNNDTTTNTTTTTTTNTTTNNNNNNNNNNTTSSASEKIQDHTLHVALLSLCVTACEKLHLKFYTMNPLGEGVAFNFARKMVQLNNDLTLDCLRMVKLITRMVIAMMKQMCVIKPDDLDLESLMNSLSSVSETMLDLESSMVFATGMPATARTLDSLVKEARELHHQIKEQGLANI